MLEALVQTFWSRPRLDPLGSQFSQMVGLLTDHLKGAGQPAAKSVRSFGERDWDRGLLRKGQTSLSVWIWFALNTKTLGSWKRRIWTFCQGEDVQICFDLVLGYLSHGVKGTGKIPACLCA